MAEKLAENIGAIRWQQIQGNFRQRGTDSWKSSRKATRGTCVFEEATAINVSSARQRGRLPLRLCSCSSLARPQSLSFQLLRLILASYRWAVIISRVLISWSMHGCMHHLPVGTWQRVSQAQMMKKCDKSAVTPRFSFALLTRRRETTAKRNWNHE
jgi:hypothetical protein